MPDAHAGQSDSQSIADRILLSGKTIYDLNDDEPDLFYDIEQLEKRLDAELRGLDLRYPIRTRSKVAKVAICHAMGYPVPKSFRRTQPRFPAQDLDAFVQKADNLQIWNEEVSPTRRYALIKVDVNDVVTDVRIVTGETIAALDSTGALTTKYQAKRRSGHEGSTLVSQTDTVQVRRILQPVDRIDARELANLSPVARPQVGRVLTVAAIHERLLGLVGQVIRDPGVVNERGRGVVLQQLVCTTLGLGQYADVGQFPDVLSQALEVKLQLSPTIDLGLVSPDGLEPAQEVGDDIRHLDMRYGVVYGEREDGDAIRLTAVVTTTGEDFFSEFQRFEGNVQNSKLQIHLPPGFFNAKR